MLGRYPFATNPFSTIASGGDGTQTILLPASTVVTASAISPSIIAGIQTDVASAAATATTPILRLSVELGSSTVVPSTALDLNLIAHITPPVVSATAIASDPGLIYEISLAPTVASATAIPPSFTYFISPTPSVAPARANNPKLVYDIILGTGYAAATAPDIEAQREPGTYYIDPINGNDANDGQSWTSAWKTMTFGATAPNIVPGDFIRVAKSNNPVAIGCTWTKGSKAVVMENPRTYGIDDCESGWSAVSGSIITYVTSSKKQGSASIDISVPVFSSGSLYAYKQIPAADLSTYQQLSLWFRVESGVVDADRWKLCLCSDALGEAIVDEFMLPNHPAPDRWMPIALNRVGSGSLGSAIQSIALYTTNTPPTSSHNVLFDNIQATRDNDLNLTTVVSKNGIVHGGLEGFWGVQSISGSTILLDMDTNCDATSGYGYYGTSETTPTYFRNTQKSPPATSFTSTTLYNVNQSGTQAVPIIYSGGWNPLLNTQDGETFYDGQNGLGIGFYADSKKFIIVERMSFFRFATGMYLTGECVGWNAHVQNLSNNTLSGLRLGERNTLNTIVVDNANSNGGEGVVVTDGPMDNKLWFKRVYSNGDAGLQLQCTNNIRIIGQNTIANNPRGIQAINCGAGVFIENTVLDNIAANTSNDCSRLTLVNAVFTGSAVTYEHLALYGHSQKTISHNHNQGGTQQISHAGGLIESMSTTRPGGSGIMWKLLTSASHRNAFDPLPLYVSQVYCQANVTTTIKGWLRKDHTTGVTGRLAVRGGQLAGISNNVTSTLSNNTSWQQLTLTVTPTESGVVQIEVWAEYVTGHHPVYYDQELVVY